MAGHGLCVIFILSASVHREKKTDNLGTICIHVAALPFRFVVKHVHTLGGGTKVTVMRFIIYKILISKYVSHHNALYDPSTMIKKAYRTLSTSWWKYYFYRFTLSKTITGSTAKLILRFSFITTVWWNLHFPLSMKSNINAFRFGNFNCIRVLLDHL